jgi:hypothetical protein
MSVQIACSKGPTHKTATTRPSRLCATLCHGYCDQRERQVPPTGCRGLPPDPEQGRGAERKRGNRGRAENELGLSESERDTHAHTLRDKRAMDVDGDLGDQPGVDARDALSTPFDLDATTSRPASFLARCGSPMGPGLYVAAPAQSWLPRWQVSWRIGHATFSSFVRLAPATSPLWAFVCWTGRPSKRLRVRPTCHPCRWRVCGCALARHARVRCVRGNRHHLDQDQGAALSGGFPGPPPWEQRAGEGVCGGWRHGERHNERQAGH